MNVNLELVSVEDLLDELERRHDTMIFAGVQTLDAQRDQRIRQGKGEWYRQMGLAFDYACYAREQMDEARRTSDDAADSTMEEGA
jgi:hypothetical protein